MTATEFFLYCAGLSTMILAGGVTTRLVRGVGGPAARPPKREAASEPSDDPAADDLSVRLRDLQQRRYAPHIVRRTLSDDAVPRHRAASRTANQPSRGPGHTDKEG